MTKNEEENIETALSLLQSTITIIQNLLDTYPAVRVTFQYGGAIETLTYDWDGKEFTA